MDPAKLLIFTAGLSPPRTLNHVAILSLSGPSDTRPVSVTPVRCRQEISAKEVEEIFGDRIRRAPAAVITGGKAARAETQPGTSRGDKKYSDSTEHNSEGAGVATAGPYKPRTSAGVGRSLEKSFSKEQVSLVFLKTER